MISRRTSRGLYGVILLVVFSGAAAVALHGCGGTSCGDGTVEKDGVCVAANSFLKCAAGFTENGGICVPDDDWGKLMCDTTRFAKWDPVTRKCYGEGGITKVCSEQCPIASGSKVCVSGQVFEMKSLFTKGKGASDVVTLKKSDSLDVQLIDPLEYLTNPKAAVLAETKVYNDNGCFIFKNATIPIAGNFNVGIGCPTSNPNCGWVGTATYIPTVSGSNSEDVPVGAIRKADSDTWGPQLVSDGTMVLWYHDSVFDSVAGVTPMLEGKAPPWPPATNYLFDKDMKLDSTSTTTSVVGAAVVHKAEFKTSYSGKKGTCTIESLTGISVKGAYFIMPVKVDGC